MSVRQISGNVFAILSSDVMNRVTSFVLYALVARHLGGHEFGQLSLALTLVDALLGCDQFVHHCSVGSTHSLHAVGGVRSDFSGLGADAIHRLRQRADEYRESGYCLSISVNQQRLERRCS